jgi:hypothetical protein
MEPQERPLRRRLNGDNDDHRERIPRDARIVAVVPETHRLQDWDQWLRNNALISSHDADASSTRINSLELARFSALTRYQEAVHDEIFAADEHQETLQRNERQGVIDSYASLLIDLTASDGIVRDVSLQVLASSCDAIFAWASSWKRFHTTATPHTDDRRSFPLERFTYSSVLAFVHVVQGDQQVDNLTGDVIVDCCQIAHFLQNSTVLDATTAILEESIDTENCYSICQLADQLQLSQLFEKSLAHMMQTLGDIQGNQEAWDDLTPELRDRIVAIQAAIQSSVHSNSRLFFSSLDEYLAMFAERVQYCRERLGQAKEENSHVTPGSHYHRDVSRKIAHQEQRVRTLQLALREQKKLFTSQKVVSR